eukprot:365428-Chlamydomonas_euryale.AAC.4
MVQGDGVRGKRQTANGDGVRGRRRWRTRQRGEWFIVYEAKGGVGDCVQGKGGSGLLCTGCRKQGDGGGVLQGGDEGAKEATMQETAWRKCGNRGGKVEGGNVKWEASRDPAGRHAKRLGKKLHGR